MPHLKKVWYKRWWAIVLFVFVGLMILGSFNNGNNYSSTLPSKNFSNISEGVYLNFKDINNSCSLDGNITVDKKIIGKTSQGNFYLTKKEYNQYFIPNSSLELDGITNLCFEKDAGLPFILGWKVPDLTYYFDNSQNIPFETYWLNPRIPESYVPNTDAYYRIAQGFIRPSETIDYYNQNIKQYMKNDTQRDLNYIGGFNFNYRGDTLLFGSDYWKTPAEFLSAGKGGDCKDYALTVLSMMENYNSSINCYDVLWGGDSEGGHMNIFCHYGNTFVIYDQEQIRSQISLSQENLNSIGLIESKVRIREMINNYYSQYGLPTDDVIEALISDKEIISFNETNNNEEFVNWAISQVS